MCKITFQEFCNIMTYDITNNQTCIEIEFSIDNYKEYQHSWLGKMLDNKSKKVVYWFGLTEDGSQAYEFTNLEQFIKARVFKGRSINEMWELVTIQSIDACNVAERMPFYLGIE